MFFVAVFLINEMLVLGEELLSNRVPLRYVLRLIVFSVPLILTFAVPFGTLVAALLFVGDIRENLELLAMQAAGFAPFRVLFSLLLIGALLTTLSFVTGDVLVPAGNIEFNRLYRRVLLGNILVELRANAANRREDMVIVTGEREGPGFRGVVIIEETEDLEKRVIVGDTLRSGETGERWDMVSLALEGVLEHTVGDDEEGDYAYTRAESMEYNIAVVGMTDTLMEVSAYEQSTVDLWRMIGAEREAVQERRRRHSRAAAALAYGLLLEIVVAADAVTRAPAEDRASRLALERERLHERYWAGAQAAGPTDDYDLRNYLFEFHKKLATPAACTVFTILAWCTGSLRSRSGRAYSLLVGGTVSAAYWGMLVVAQRIALLDRGFPPAVMAWLPDLVIMVLAATLAARRSWP